MLNAKLFRSEEVHARQIVLGDGSTEVLHFREMDKAQELHAQKLASDNTEAGIQRSKCYLIAISLCSETGEPVITEEEAMRLKPGVRNALSHAIAEVNGVGAYVGKVSPPEVKSGSGTSSV